MFKANLKARCERIFGFSKTTFQAPDYEAPEQDVLFLEINDVRSRMTTAENGRETAIVHGAAIVFCEANKLPFGFFKKRLEKASAADKGNLCFQAEHDVANSPARFVNLHERRCPFVFLYDSQYDPDKGSLTDATFSLTFEE